jgi:ferric-dicitrate binding protein FerR (iron transport regulator)
MTWTGLSLTRAEFDAAIASDSAEWRTELEAHEEHLLRLEDRLPAELAAIRDRYAARVANGGAPPAPFRPEAPLLFVVAVAVAAAVWTVMSASGMRRGGK